MGKYHPHGDAPIYEAMARLAQDFSMRYAPRRWPGQLRQRRWRSARRHAVHRSQDDAHHRRTARRYRQQHRRPLPELRRLADAAVGAARARPQPARQRRLGIAVGMATNIPPHNLSEICDAVIKLIENPETTTEELAEIVKGPDFPTAGIIFRMRATASSTTRASATSHARRHQGSLRRRPRPHHHAGQGAHRGDGAAVTER